MITKKDSRKEKRRQEREEQMNALLEIQRRRLDMEAEKQAKMLEIEATNAKTKAKEVALASMMTGVHYRFKSKTEWTPDGRPTQTNKKWTNSLSV
ncbi:Phospholipid-transporting ATPase 1 [Hordeum vulgare]|nr:Phospholipid-transporting ATPase 1 [Hordeum vulgare]